MKSREDLDDSQLLNRSEPAKTLFELPAGFTVSEGFPGLFKQAPLPAKVKKRSNPE